LYDCFGQSICCLRAERISMEGNPADNGLVSACVALSPCFLRLNCLQGARFSDGVCSLLIHPACWWK